MKKRILSLALVVILTLTLLPLSLTTVSFASTTEEDTAEQLRIERLLQESFTFHYFYNLRKNVGVNTYNSCGYIALAMLLSFYDCYWDDNLVPDSYMVSDDLSLNSYGNETIITAYENYSSPGSPEAVTEADVQMLYTLLQRATTAEEKCYAWSLFASLMDIFYGDISLHSRLIGMLNEMSSSEEYASSISPKDDGQVYFDDLVLLLDYYLEWRDGPDFDKENWQAIPYFIDENFPTTDALKEKAIEYIVQGVPVLLTLRYKVPDSNGGTKTHRHALIAYDYNAEQDSIFGHIGGENVENITHKDIQSFAVSQPAEIESFLVLLPLGEHVHSNNYIFDDAPEGVCSCELPNHHHEGYVSCSADEHSIICWCGAAPMPHRFQAQGLNRAICIDCGFVKILDLDTPIVRPLDLDLPPVQPDSVGNEEEKA